MTPFTFRIEAVAKHAQSNKITVDGEILSGMVSVADVVYPQGGSEETGLAVKGVVLGSPRPLGNKLSLVFVLNRHTSNVLAVGGQLTSVPSTSTM